MSFASIKEALRKILGVIAFFSGVITTAYFVAGDEWRKALISFSTTIVLSLLATGWRLLKRLRDQFLFRIEERLDKSAEELGDLLYSKFEGLLLKLWWRMTSDFQGDYYKALIFKHRNYQTQGLKSQGPFKLDLQKIFVPLRVAPESPERISAAMIREGETAANLEVWDFLATLTEHRAYLHIAVLGAPGSGKTTLLEQLVLTYALNEQRRAHRKSPKLIPVLLYLRTIQAEITSARPPSLSEVINEQELIKWLEPLPIWFEEKLKKGKCLVMLDGLDEVADEHIRTKVSQWVNRQMEMYPRNPFIVTSRPYGYRSAPIEQVGLMLEIQPFNIGQVETFVGNWYVQHESMRQMRKEDWGVWEAARVQSEDLFDRIKNNHALAEMAVNPLLLTMIATVHDNTGRLPERRVELYREICEVLLARREAAKAKRAPDLLTSMHKQAVLQVLALELMRRNVRTFDIETAGSLIQEILLTVKGEESDHRLFLREVENVSGLIVEREMGWYEFAHMSFQEYLAAVEIRDTTQETLLIDNVNNEWWAETIRLYAAQTDATNLIRAAIASSTVEALTLGYDCLEEGARVQPEVRKELGDSLESGLESNDTKIRRLAAEVKLSRRLSRLVRIDEHLEIDCMFISCAEYQLFIDEKLKKREYFQPDHWQGRSFGEGTASDPIAGVRYSDADEFCKWLTGRYSLSAFEFRLPTSSEVEHHPTAGERLAVGCWCKDGLNCYVAGIDNGRLESQQESVIRVLAYTIAKSISLRDSWAPLNQEPDRLANSLDLNKVEQTVNDLIATEPHGRKRDIIKTIKRTVVRAIGIADKIANSSIARDLAIVPDIARDLQIGLDRVRSLLELDLDSDLDEFRGVDSDLDRDIDLTGILMERLSLARSFAIEVGHDLVGAIEMIDDFGLDMAPTIRPNLDRVLDRSQERDSDFAYRRLRSFVLLHCVILNGLRDPIETVTGVDESSIQTEKSGSSPNMIRQKTVDKSKRDRAFEIYMLLALMSSRVKGRVPSWEGIRIVRALTEHNDDASLSFGTL